MAKKQKQEQEEQPVEQETQLAQPVEEKAEEPKEKKPEKAKEEVKSKFKIGDIVYISKEAESDLNGFKLFPQYKKYTYTVEGYNQSTGVYTLRQLNLLLELPEALILAPDEKNNDALIRRQF